MSDQEIISALVKGRERFRKIVNIYRDERDRHAASAPAFVSGCNPDVAALRSIDGVLASALAVLNALPQKPVDACADEENRRYAAVLLKEIGDLLDAIMVLDREMRAVCSRISAPAAPAAGRGAAVRGYAMA